MVPVVCRSSPHSRPELRPARAHVTSWTPPHANELRNQQATQALPKTKATSSRALGPSQRMAQHRVQKPTPGVLEISSQTSPPHTTAGQLLGWSLPLPECARIYTHTHICEHALCVPVYYTCVVCSCVVCVHVLYHVCASMLRVHVCCMHTCCMHCVLCVNTWPVCACGTCVHV